MNYATKIKVIIVKALNKINMAPLLRRVLDCMICHIKIGPKTGQIYLQCKELAQNNIFFALCIICSNAEKLRGAAATAAAAELVPQSKKRKRKSPLSGKNVYL